MNTRCRHRGERKARIRAANEARPAIEAKLSEYKLHLTVSFLKRSNHSKPTPHWQIRDESGEVVLHFWPSKGSWRNPADETKGVVSVPVGILDIVSLALAKRLLEA